MNLCLFVCRAAGTAVARPTRRVRAATWRATAVPSASTRTGRTTTGRAAPPRNTAPPRRPPPPPPSATNDRTVPETGPPDFLKLERNSSSPGFPCDISTLVNHFSSSNPRSCVDFIHVCVFIIYYKYLQGSFQVGVYPLGTTIPPLHPDDAPSKKRSET